VLDGGWLDVPGTAARETRHDVAVERMSSGDLEAGGREISVHLGNRAMGLAANDEQRIRDSARRVVPARAPLSPECPLGSAVSTDELIPEPWSSIPA
jgi:hypothetical protein